MYETDKTLIHNLSFCNNLNTNNFVVIHNSSKLVENFILCFTKIGLPNFVTIYMYMFYISTSNRYHMPNFILSLSYIMQDNDFDINTYGRL